VDQLRKLLEQEPADPFLLYAMAQELARLGDHAAALGWYDRCLAADPGYCYAYYHKARSQQSLGDVAGAAATVVKGKEAARRTGDGHALSELTTMEAELE
jgi:tetratricopeptide (TPR) repeat protein